jgi:hypothetical protein
MAMANRVSIAERRAERLNERKDLYLDLPEWVIRVLEYRVAEANDGAPDDERVSINDVVEWYLVSPLTVGEVPILEQSVPGIGHALSIWIRAGGYEGPV